MLLKSFVIALSTGVVALSAPALAADPMGTWLTGDGDAGVEIAPCPAPGTPAATPAAGPARPPAPAASPAVAVSEVCGTIVWLKVPIDPDTRKPPVDQKNSDPVMRQRPILGLPMMRMKADAKGNWAGSIYNSDDGSTYNATMSVDAPTKVTIRGCWGPFCGSDSWTKMAAVPASATTPGTQGSTTGARPSPATQGLAAGAKPAPAVQGAPPAQGTAAGVRR